MKKKLIMVAIAVAAICSVGCKKKTTAIDLDMVDIPGMEIKMLSTEVTQKLYESIMGENPSQIIGDNNPVENVSWYDAIYFCNKLSEKLGLTPVYSVNGSMDVSDWRYTPHINNSTRYYNVKQNISANGFRLPTKDEWEYAAKGKGKKDYISSKREKSLNKVSWNLSNSKEEPHSVAKKAPNGYGLYDMHGNVSEWLWDSFFVAEQMRSLYPKSFRDNDPHWVIGANFLTQPYAVPITSGLGYAFASSNDMGFRIVCKKKEKSELSMVKIPNMKIKMLSTEVTQKLYESIMGENPSQNIGENNPVENVSWYDAIYFCNKLSEKFKLTPVYSVDGSIDVTKWNYTPHKLAQSENETESISGDIKQNAKANGFRLPTKEEWVYAAKGGQGYSYSGSAIPDEVAWYSSNSRYETAPVAQKKVNGYGLYDMSGNVWEWCWTFDPNSQDNSRYICGGSYRALDYYCGVDDSYGNNADCRRRDLGFRIVCSSN